MTNALEKAKAGFDEVSSKRISYVLATKNRAELVREALEKSKALLGPDDELLVIDGGSTDNTADIVASFGGLVSIFLSEVDNNAYEASNKGVMLARGKFVYTMSDDDEIYRDGAEKAITVLENNPQIDMLVCGGIRFFGSRPVPYWLPPGTNYGLRPEDPFIYKACGMGFFYRRRTFAKFGLFDSIAADIDFLTHLIFKGGTAKFCRIKLFNHKIFPHSVVKSKKAVHRKARLLTAWRYCPKSFYVKYRLVTAIKESGLWKLYRRLIRAFRVKVLGKPFKRKKNTQYIWDGGFS